ncbi:MAG TPA: hypothetical protein VM370_12270, partial [Candidatus Thermoplasmatota archaeon]|nr:hypothetical protein [Candidatus Thermoplasmatota archaeon]
PPVTGNVTGSEFLDRLGPLSEELVDAAKASFDEANATIAATPESAARTNLAERLASSKSLLGSAANATANQTYYTAASLSFQSSIESRYVREAAQYLAATDRAAAHAQSVAEARGIVQRVERAVSSSPVRDTNSFEAVGAAQVRIMEAEERLAAAQDALANARSPQDLFDSLYNASYAAERADTAQWWLKLSEGFPKGEPVEGDALEELARDTITTSTEEVAYVSAVFVGAGTVAPLGQSRELLDTAEKAMARGYYAAAMLTALEASVRASVFLEMAGYGGAVPATKFESAREGAARAIQGARARGVESLLAQSAYEFGLSLERPDEKLSFLGVARVTGNLAGLPGLFDAQPSGLSTRFQSNPPAFRVDVLYVAAAFAVGLALGAGAGLTALMPRGRREGSGLPAGAPDASEPVWTVPSMVATTGDPMPRSEDAAPDEARVEEGRP